MNADVHIVKARRLFEEGEEARAREVVIAWRAKAPEDPVIHTSWGDLCRELGMARQARESYERALRIASDAIPALYGLAVLLGDTGHMEDSVHYLKKTLRKDPHHTAAKGLLAEHYRALGLHGQAEMLAPGPLPAPEPERYFPPAVGGEDTARFLSLFRGKEVGYALQQIDEQTGESTFDFKERPLTTFQVERHIAGEMTLAAYPLRSDNTLKFAAVSVRVRKRVIGDNLKNLGYLAYLDEKARFEALSIRSLAYRAGVPAYTDHPGKNMYRVWFFFREFIHFLNVRDFLKRLLIDRPELGGPFVIEPLTGTRGIGVGWREQSILLPLGLNRTTGDRILFLDEEGEPFPEQLRFLKKIREIPFREALAGVQGLSASEAGRQRKGVSRLDPWVKRCAVIEELAQKARSGRILRHEEKMVLFYTVGLSDEDGNALHRILETCPDYRYSRAENQRERLKPNPMSCVKIRELLPEITASVSCNCSFDLRGGKYPTPLLHLKSDLVPACEEFEVPDGVPLREVAKRHVNLMRQFQEIERALLRTSVVLEGYFRRKGVERIRIGNTTLVRRVRESGSGWEMEGRS